MHADRVRLQRDLPVEDLLEGARRLDALGIGLGMLCQNFTGKRLVRLASDGCRVRLLFLNPASSAVRRRERELGLGRGELSRSIEMNIMHVRRVRARLRDPGGFEIRVFDEMPRSPPTWWRAPGCRAPGGAPAIWAWCSRTCAGHAGSSRRRWCCAPARPAPRVRSRGCWRSTGRSSRGLDGLATC